MDKCNDLGTPVVYQAGGVKWGADYSASVRCWCSSTDLEDINIEMVLKMTEIL